MKSRRLRTPNSHYHESRTSDDLVHRAQTIAALRWELAPKVSKGQPRGLVTFETFPLRLRQPTSKRTSICVAKGQKVTLRLSFSLCQRLSNCASIFDEKP